MNKWSNYTASLKNKLTEQKIQEDASFVLKNERPLFYFKSFPDFIFSVNNGNISFTSPTIL